MPLTDIVTIIRETLAETERDLLTLAEQINRVVAVTVQVMDALKGLDVEMSTRDLQDALLVQKIVGKVRERE